MAFNRQDMARVASASTGAQANWLYRTQDLLSLILSTGYFDKSFTDLKVDDLIQVKNNEGYFFVAILTSSHQGVTVEQVLESTGEINTSSNLGNGEGVAAPKVGSDLPFKSLIAGDGLEISSTATEITISQTPSAPFETLVAFSIVNQVPTGLDAVLQIEFGAAQGTPSDPSEIDANGMVTINEDGVYGFRYIFSISRNTSAGEAYIFIRGLIDGVQSGNPISVIMTDDEMTIPLELTFTAFFPATTEVTIEMYRDSQGTNNGQLETRASNIGWGQSPSASLRLTKFG